MLKRFARLAAVLGLAICIGCSSKEATYEVTGKVTYRDTSLPQGVVVFTPEHGRPQRPTIIEKDGSYRMNVPAGKYRVAVVAMPNVQEVKQGHYLEEANVSIRSHIPERYGNPATSGLEVTVEVGKSNNHDLILYLNSR